MTFQQNPLNAACKAVAQALPRAALDSLATDHDLEDVVLALRVHIARGVGQSPPSPRRRGGLTPRKEKLAKDLLMASMRGGVPVEEIARTIGLSRGHFIRAFHESTGETPHRWLTARKVEKAQNLLAGTRMPLTEIALACGFSDQSHFTRVFSRVSGSPPGAWRHNLG